MYRRFTLSVLVLMLAGCSLLEPAADTTTTTVTIPDEETLPTTATTDAGPATDAPCLAGDRPFARDGVISAFGGANGDATQVSAIRWAGHEGCERVVVDLLTADGAPASAIDAVGVDYDEGRGIIRVSLPEALARSAIADSRFDGDLIDGVYVVATGNNHLAIDLHVRAGAAIALRAFEVDSPSRIVVDIRSDAEATPVTGATRGSQAVILNPEAGPSATTVIVSGYAKGPGDELTARFFTDPGLELVLSTTIDLDGDKSLWREYRARVPALPEQSLQLVVGFGLAEPTDSATVKIDTTLADIVDPPDV